MGPGCCSLTPVWLSPLLSTVCCAAATIGMLAAAARSAELWPRNFLLLKPSLLSSTLTRYLFHLASSCTIGPTFRQLDADLALLEPPNSRPLTTQFLRERGLLGPLLFLTRSAIRRTARMPTPEDDDCFGNLSKPPGPATPAQ